MKVEGELLKLFIGNLFPVSGGAREEVSFAEVFNQFLTQLTEGEKSPEENRPEIKTDKLLSLLPFQNGYFPAQVPIKERVSLTKKINFENRVLQKDAHFEGNRSNTIDFKVARKELRHKPFRELEAIEILEKSPKNPIGFENNLKDETYLLPVKAKKSYKAGPETNSSKGKALTDISSFPEKSSLLKFKDAEGVSNYFNFKNINKEIDKKVEGEKRLILKPEGKLAGSEKSTVHLPSKAYEIELSPLPREVKSLERVESALPVIREAVFKEDGKVKKAFVKVENINIEVKLIRDRVEIQFSVPNGKESMLGFMDYLKISQILNSVGLRVEGFSVNGQEVYRPRLRLREKDNINLDELTQKGRDYLNGSSSFSIAL